MLLNLIAVFFVCSGIGIAIHIAYDLRSHRQAMKIMNAVWILTGLWGSYLALWAYYKFGRGQEFIKVDGKDVPITVDKDGLVTTDDGMDMSMDMGGDKPMDGMDMDKPMDMSDSQPSKQMNMNIDMKDMDKDEGMKDMDMGDMNMSMDMEKKRPHWQSVALSALHCGAGCSLADIIGHWASRHIFGFTTVIGDFVLDFILALIIGVYFQFYAIREMEKIAVSKGLAKAFKSDFFSLTSWQIGMYGWMCIVYFAIFRMFPLETTAWIFWFMMQIAMLFGFFCAYPMNALLIKLGVKKGM